MTTIADQTALKQKEAKQENTNFDLEIAVRTYFINKAIAKERTEENKMLKEQIENGFEEMNGTELIVELEDGTFAKVFKKASIKEKLDKEMLVLKINDHANVSDKKHKYITKDDLKSVWDFSMLTKQERVTPKMIAECTITDTSLNTSLSKLKNKPKKKK